MTHFHKYLLLVFLLIAGTVRAQEKPEVDKHRADSLIHALDAATEDTVTVKTLNELGRLYMDADPSKAFVYASRAEELALKLGRKKSLAQAYYIKANCYEGLQSYNDALEYLYKALPLREEQGDRNALVRIYNQIGIIYAYQKDYNNSLKYFLKFLNLAEQMHDSMLQANVANNIGVTYKNLGKRNVGSEYFYRALKIFTALGNKRGMASAYTNLATLLNDDGENQASVDFNLKAQKLFRESKSEYGMITTYVNLAESYGKLDKDKLALAYYDSAMTLAVAGNDKLHLRDLYDGLYKLYAKERNTDKAFEYLLKFTRLKDSLFTADNASRSSGLELKYKMEQNQKQVEFFKKSEELSALQNTQNKTYIGLLFAVVLVIALLALFVLSRYRQNKKQTQLLEYHNSEIEHQKKEITDSINYAKKIQMSILPPDTLVNTLLPDSFVLYKPKDIVSGDFYWVDECDGKVLFASVDCTGHGVPGAMMSVLGFNLLSQAVNEKRITNPAAVLEHLDYGVDKMLRQSTDENSVRDGMDISICSIDFKTGLLQFAGAYNNLWMVKHETREFIEIKADKMMIGVNAGGEADHFTNHEIQLRKGDVVYIFSDGYADQFGGPGGKKFKYKPMKQLLVDIHELSMKDQRKKLDENIEKWRGNLEQVDDILVIGVRYS